MEQIDYAEMLPLQPPEGMTQFLYNNGYLMKNAIVYRIEFVLNPLSGKKERKVKCVCSACGGVSYHKKVTAGECARAYASAPFGYFDETLKDAVIDGNCTLCPCCGSEVTAKYSGRMCYGEYTIQQEFPVSIHRIDNKIAIIEWQANNVVNSDGKKEIKYKPCEAAVVEKKKIVRLNALRRYLYGYVDLEGWEQRKKFVDGIGKKAKKLIFPFDSHILDGTPSENSKLDVYLCDSETPIPVSYMKLWQIHKNTENLVMQGASEIVTDRMTASTSYDYYNNSERVVVKNISGINWKECKPHRMLGITKDDFRYMTKNKFRGKDLDFYKKFREHIQIDEVKAACAEGENEIESAMEWGENIGRILRYLAKQKERYKWYTGRITLSELLDYWNMAKKLGEDFKKIAYPKNLISAHDRLVDRVEWIEKPELKEMFIERSEQLKPLCFCNEELEIHPAKSQHEMIVEGRVLDHCVAGYAKKYAEGKTAIFFIRHCSQPEVPYFTLELDEESLKVRQNRGYRNCDRTAEVIKFEAQWLEYIKEVKANERNNRSRVS